MTPDHLDRHYTLENYAEMKARLFVHQRDGDFAVLECRRSHLPELRGIAERRSRCGSARRRRVSPGACLDAGAESCWTASRLCPLRRFRLRGMHNIENTMAAAAIARLAGAAHAQIRSAVMSFPGVEHRLEFVRELNGVAWYNDSKATNVDATLKAIDAFPGRAVDHSRRQGQEQRLHACSPRRSRPKLTRRC